MCLKKETNTDKYLGDIVEGVTVDAEMVSMYNSTLIMCAALKVNTFTNKKLNTPTG